jgi:hypothetical protein
MLTTAGGKNAFFCAPVDVPKGVTAVGNIFYPTPLACMNGHNAYNTSYLCAKGMLTYPYRAPVSGAEVCLLVSGRQAAVSVELSLRDYLVY